MCNFLHFTEKNLLPNMPWICCFREKGNPYILQNVSMYLFLFTKFVNESTIVFIHLLKIYILNKAILDKLKNLDIYLHT